MSLLPRVSDKARERASRDFDLRGPDVCTAEIVTHLRRYNPELLDMAMKCAADLENPTKAMVGFSMFYRLLIPQFPPTGDMRSSFLPRVSAETRSLLVAEIDEKGSDSFTVDAISELERSNPELLQMAHNFAAGLGSYLPVMQGFALLYRSLVIQSKVQRHSLH
jgi:hypothetical protein